MADSSPVDVILEFLRKNKFSKAEAALRSELGSKPELNGILQSLTLDDKDSDNSKSSGEEVKRVPKKIKSSCASGEDLKDSSSSTNDEVSSKELIVKEVECRTSDKNSNFAFSKSPDDTVLDLNSWKYGTSNGPIAFNQADGNDFLGFQVSGKAKLNPLNPKSSEDASFSGDRQKNLSNGSIKTAFPFSKGDMPTSYDISVGFVDKKDGKKKAEFKDIRAAIKEQVDEVSRALLFGKAQGVGRKDFGTLDFHLTSDIQKEELPRLPPVRLKSEDNPFSIHWEEKHERDGHGPKILNADNSYLIGPFLDVPIGQEIITPGKRLGGGNWLSVSQGIVEDTFDPVSGFATIGDGLAESIDYPNEYWDSDEYDDDDDVGYMRQPIEDETYFLAHEVDYPSDNENQTGQTSVQETGQNKNEEAEEDDDEDDQSFAEEDSYLSGERYLLQSEKNDNDLMEKYDGQLMDGEELSLMRGEPVWQGFVTQSNDLIMLGDRKNTRCTSDDNICTGDNNNKHGSVRSIGVGINSESADIGGSIDGDIEYLHLQRELLTDETAKKVNCRTKRRNNDGGFSFPPPRDGQLVQTNSCKSLWSNQANTGLSEGANDHDVGNDDDVMLTSWKQKSDGSSPGGESENSSPSSLSNCEYVDRERVKREGDVMTGVKEEEPLTSLEDEEAAAVQEQVRQIKAQEDEFETFDLKILHRKNRTGFEEDKNFHVVLNQVIAGRYHVTEYLGSAAFSKAIQAHDLHTGLDVCVKIIKNNKDFFDQSLDEIKLLKYVNKHDPADKYHLLRLYDYFYYREHLLIVCELLKANLYEFHKFNRESGGEVYFTMPRLQSITIQCLEALEFLHRLGIIHCDLKPENILVKSYSRCEVKVIDLGSSCFETDHLCSYVQSRSYRAPEVILGLPYDKKIDVWSLGCILAELCTGNVLFQNDSLATLLARVIGITGPIELEMLTKGKDTYKYFTKNHMLYERNQDTSGLEYLIPKRSSLRHRLPMGDQGFIDFVGHLLEANPKKRPSASEALKHPWLQYAYEPISS